MFKHFGLMYENTVLCKTFTIANSSWSLFWCLFRSYLSLPFCLTVFSIFDFVIFNNFLHSFLIFSTIFRCGGMNFSFGTQKSLMASMKFPFRPMLYGFLMSSWVNCKKFQKRLYSPKFLLFFFLLWPARLNSLCILLTIGIHFLNRFT